MVFVKRDAQNKIFALLENNDEGSAEELDGNDPEVLLFLKNCLGNKQLELFKSDLGLIRVLEDLIQILMEKNIISITDFPAPVIKKLVQRNTIRNLFKDVGSIIDKDEQENI